MLTTAETFTTVLHFAYVDSSSFTLYILGFCCSIPCGRYASSTTLLRQVRNGYRRCGAYARTTALGSERAGRSIQESIFSGGRRRARDDGWDLHGWRLLVLIDDGHRGRRGQQRGILHSRNLGRLMRGILIRLFVGLFVHRSRVECSFKGCQTLLLRSLFIVRIVVPPIFSPAYGRTPSCLGPRNSSWTGRGVGRRGGLFDLKRGEPESRGFGVILVRD